VAIVRLGVGSKSILVLAAATIVLAGLKLAQGIVLPLLVSIFIAAATAPIVGWLRRRGIPTYLAVAFTTLGVLAGLTGFGIAMTLAATDLTESLPLYERALHEAKVELAQWLQSHRLGRFSTTVLRFDGGAIGERLVTGAVAQAPVTLSAAGTVLFIVIFILLEAATFRTKLRRALDWRAERFDDIRGTMLEVQKYLLVKTAISTLVGVLCGAWCLIMGLRDGVFWGMVSFALNFIPVFGSLIATVGASVMGTLQIGLSMGIVLFLGLLLIHNAVGNLLEPKVMGAALGLSPLVVTVSIVAWGWLLGPIGALLSVPLMMAIKIVAANTPDLRWLAILLGPGEGRVEKEYAEARQRTRLRRNSDASLDAPGAAE
jgi:predicted PurR-regulated permease PerM